MSTEKTVTAASAWSAQAYPIITLPSGAVVKIRIPDLPALIESGEIPQHLLDAALGVAAKPNKTPSKDLIVQQREFTDCLVMQTVVEPELSEADLHPKTGIPYPDKEMLVEIATRQRDLDAEGNHVGGLQKSERWRKFRGLDSLYEDVEDV